MRIALRPTSNAEPRRPAINAAIDTAVDTAVIDAHPQSALSGERELLQDPRMQNLLDHFDRSYERLGQFVVQARQGGKTDEQIRLLSDLLSTANGTNLGKVLADGLGLFDQTVYNALATVLLDFISKRDVLLHAFARPKLLRKFDIYVHHLMYVYAHFDHRHLSRAEYQSKLHITEWDRVLIYFAKDITLNGFVAFREAQFDFEKQVANKELFENPTWDPVPQRPLELEEPADGTLQLERDPERDAQQIGTQLQRFMTADQIRPIVASSARNHMTGHTTDGAFHSLAFPSRWDCCTLV